MSVVTNQNSTSLDLERDAERQGPVISERASMWLVVLAPPFLALLNLKLSSAMAPWSCRTGDHVLVNTSTALLLVAVIICAFDATGHLRHDWAAKSVVSLAGLMAILGVFSSAISAGVIVSQWLQVASLVACK